MADARVVLRRAVVDPIPEVLESGLLLEEAGAWMIAGDRARAAAALREADMRILYEHYRDRKPHVSPRQARPLVPKEMRARRAKPTAALLRDLFARDGWRCRFCDVRVIEAAVRNLLRSEFPGIVRWGKRDVELHAGILVHMGTHDHVLPVGHGGTNEIANLVAACWTCQFARGEWLVEEVGVMDPRLRPPIVDSWDGLRRLLGSRAA